MTRGGVLRSSPRAAAAVVLAAALLLSGVAVTASRALSRPSLPPITPEGLVASALRAAAAPPPISGLVDVRLDLGIPSLPNQGPQPTGLPGTLAALAGEHTLRVWSSRDGYRLSELMAGAERSVFVTRTDLWTWDSRSFRAVHVGPFPSGATGATGATGPAGSAPSAPAFDPLAIARRALGAIDPTTAITVGTAQRAAGRAAYTLVLTPRTPGTLIGRIEVAIDAGTRVPLGVDVFARGAGSPAVSVRFTSVSFDPIDPSIFRFTPPPGATIERPYRERPGEHDATEPPGAFSLGSLGLGTGSLQGTADSVRTIGTGWAAFVAIRVPRPPASGEAAGLIRELLPFSGTLFSARLVERGDHAWLLAGAVPQSALARAEPSLP